MSGPTGKPESTGKERAFRIQLDHYKSPDAVARTKWALTAIALVCAAAWVTWALASRDGAPLVSHGPLSESHAVWESDCNACHTPGAPLRAGAVALGGSAMSQRCQSCHQVADHHSQRHESDQACAACHLEHRGLQADLTRVVDSACTACHADLQEQFTGVDLADVTSFPEGHPEFRSVPVDRAAGDPGRLGFTHSRHMRLGLASSPGGKPSELPTAALERYATGESTAVQLECASCHQLQSPDGASFARSGTFLPVNYEQHCQACHPLHQTADPQSDLVPHGLTAGELESYLTRSFRSQWFDTDDEQTKAELARPVPGRSELLKQSVVSALENVTERLASAQQHLRERCQQCHAMQAGSLDVAPTNVPAVWLTKARFDHYPHRVVGCQECHPAAYDNSLNLPLADRKQESRAVMIPALENCVRCHAPQSSESTTGAVGGVRHDCALCHPYHVGEGAHHGGLTIPDFLQGARDANSTP